MKYRNVLSFFISSWMLLALSGCCRTAALTIVDPETGYTFVFDESPQPCDETKLQGAFVDSRYFDAMGLFSVEVPSQYCCEIIENLDDTELISETLFDSKLGPLLRVCATSIPDDLFAELYLNHLADELALQTIIYAHLADVQLQFPQLEIVEEESMGSIDDPAHFVSIRIPIGEVITTDIGTREVACEMGHLTFFCEDQVVILTCALSPFAPPKEAEKKAVLLEELTRLRQSYRNESSARFLDL